MFQMHNASKNLDDILLHYGVKGMKWRERKAEDLSVSEDIGAGGSGESTDPLQRSKDDLAKTEAQLDEIGSRLEALKSKTGNGPLDMLKYIITGKTKKVTKRNVVDMDILGKKIKDVKGIVGSGPKDMLKYLLTGKKKIQHSGVMGMKWGVRRDRNRPGGADGKADAKDKPIRTALGKKWNSLKRERQWNSVLKEMDNLSTKDITTIARRVSLENSLKTLSRSKFGTKKDKADYLRRERMDDQELSRHVIRLRAKESLHNAVKSASKEQREFGQKIAHIGGSIGLRYALTRQLPGPMDIFETVKKPKTSYDKAKGDVLNVVMEKIKAQNGNR